jgi:HPt (histidine-containing phosphotransfer) domain-containing protein
LRNAVLRNDRDGVSRAAHKLKGASANVGAERLQALAQDLENNACDLSLQAAQAAVDALDDAWADVRRSVDSK